MSTKGVTLTRFTASTVQYSDRGALRQRLEVSEPVGMEPEVFLWQELPVNPNTGEAKSIFLGVASPFDIATYPVEAPNEYTPFPFYRTKEVELDYPSYQTALDAYNDIEGAITQLTISLANMERLTAVSSVRIGAPATNSESASASDSVS